MIPVPLLVAFALAFWGDPTVPTAPLADISIRLLETLGGIAGVAALSAGLGYWVAFAVGHGNRAPASIRARYGVASRLLAVIGLATYAWIIHWVGWSRIVRGNCGLEGSFLLDDLLILLPYITIQFCLWCGVYMADRALRGPATWAGGATLGRFLWLRSRQSFGLFLPVLLAYLFRGDVLDRFWPEWDRQPWAEFLEVAALGTLVILAAPLFVRIAWPMRTMPDGPTRRRLERAADRAGFRFTDILVWDTGHTMVNACVSGVLPHFRYVMLTDLLLDTLTPQETAAVFGHEIGHVVHGHQLYLGLFFLGSVGVLALVADALTIAMNLLFQGRSMFGWADQLPVEMVEAALLLLLVALYFWRVFGGLSRTFERQADVYGTKIVSCELPSCPPHATDSETPDESCSVPGIEAQEIQVVADRGAISAICPVGVHTFTTALANVARLNGIELTRYSWRHGSISRRIAFVESLARGPETDRQFQRRVQRHKLALGLIFIAAIAVEVAWIKNGL